ncbi:MAG: alpha/beta fold hydrolase [Gammaproteobacteria bacterium]|nr:alpha/beta fold hydrolase [Gammaproteobacteria bacterium]
MTGIGYISPLLLRHADLQAALSNSGWRRDRVLVDATSLLGASEPLLIECNDGVRLTAQHTPALKQSGRVAILLHGWEGSAGSLHVVSAGNRLWHEGFRIVRINMRDHGDSQHLNREIFHSCRLDEMIEATRWVRDRFPGESLYLAGFSLGGNFALRIAAADGPALGLARVAAVCPVLDPEETMVALDSGLKIYQQYYLRKWRRSLERKAELFPADYAFGKLSRFRSLREMTSFFVTNYTEFPDLASYLRGYAITGDRLAGLAVPSGILLADDDPVVPAASVARLARPATLSVHLTRWGGHCGFLADYRLRTWSDDYLVREFSPSTP